MHVVQGLFKGYVVRVQGLGFRILGLVSRT